MQVKLWCQKYKKEEAEIKINLTSALWYGPTAVKSLFGKEENVVLEIWYKAFWN